ncbi:hypothetical protein G7054_g9727 [Neopestalotiopsis clavispora]|nr:hypothetical protein G7054_g9727 [Neopestalotiopsis clavispora]
MASSRFNPLTATTADLRRMLESNDITSLQIIEQYLEQIDRHEKQLNALACVAPRDDLRRIASSLDDERRGGKVRSALHGVPIVLKDCFITSSELGMTTCAGAAAFSTAKASGNSAIAQKLIDAGLIILAKANMTEFAGLKTSEMLPGWSAVGGQTISPYVGAIKPNEKILGHSMPGGSSTGSAVAVAAGFSPLTMGTETIGSIVTPAIRAGLYALKPTVGVQDPAGMYRMSNFYDSPGPMGKCAADIISLSEILLGQKFGSDDETAWQDLGIAFLDPEVWNMDSSQCEQLPGTAEQMVKEYRAIVARIEQQGCLVKFPVDIADISKLEDDGKHVTSEIAFWEFKRIGIPGFIAGFSDCPVADLEDIIHFNEQHKIVAMPEPYTGQDQLIRSRDTSQSIEFMDDARARVRQRGKAIINEVFEKEGVNLIGAPGDSPLCVHAAAAG